MRSCCLKTPAKLNFSFFQFLNLASRKSLENWARFDALSLFICFRRGTRLFYESKKYFWSKFICALIIKSLAVGYKVFIGNFFLHFFFSTPGEKTSVRAIKDLFRIKFLAINFLRGEWDNHLKIASRPIRKSSPWTCRNHKAVKRGFSKTV